jgi:hypothetical protein
VTELWSSPPAVAGSDSAGAYARLRYSTIGRRTARVHAIAFF